MASCSFWDLVQVSDPSVNLCLYRANVLLCNCNIFVVESPIRTLMPLKIRYVEWLMHVYRGSKSSSWWGVGIRRIGCRSRPLAAVQNYEGHRQ
ncbi:hypothetical protein TNCV_4677371 [Trichonephila clavipes]|nr:hypothetical protein TNCV_4677371 [Trichonephila clavipes]